MCVCFLLVVFGFSMLLRVLGAFRISPGCFFGSLQVFVLGFRAGSL